MPVSASISYLNLFQLPQFISNFLSACPAFNLDLMAISFIVNWFLIAQEFFQYFTIWNFQSLILGQLAENSASYFLKFCGYSDEFLHFVLLFSEPEIAYKVHVFSFISCFKDTSFCFESLLLHQVNGRNNSSSTTSCHQSFYFLSLTLSFLFFDLQTHTHFST